MTELGTNQIVVMKQGVNKVKQELVSWFIYRWRYIFGYGLLALLYVSAVVIASLYIPGGLTQTEINNLQITNSLADGNYAITNLPWHYLQLLSLSFFGVSIFTIKLPSIVLSMIGAIAIFFLLKRWFKSNIAILSMLIMVATGQFIYIAQYASPHILYVVYSSLILLSSSLILQNAKPRVAWKILLTASVGLSLYTPHFIYINLVLLIVALIHPLTRLHLFKKSETYNWVIALSIFSIVISPLAYIVSQAPELLSSLIDHQMLISSDLVESLKALQLSYFWTEPVIVNNQIAPLLDFSSIFLAILGILVLFRQAHLARTYMIVAWGALTIPILLTDPSLTIITIVPLFILLALGIETLLGEWYKIFPLNPYARVTGLIFSITLIGVMALSGIDRFVNGYRFMPAAADRFSTDLVLVKKQLATSPVKTLLITSEDEAPLYKSLAKFDKNELLVEPKFNRESTNVILTHQTKTLAKKDWQLTRIITNGRSNNADRLYLYKAPEKEYN